MFTKVDNYLNCNYFLFTKALVELQVSKNLFIKNQKTKEFLFYFFLDFSLN